MASVVIGDYEYTTISALGVRVRVRDRSKQSYGNIQPSVQIGGKLYLTTSLQQCFLNCTNMVVAPNIFLSPAARQVNMKQCFQGCEKLTSINRIPDYTTTMEGCFEGCSSLSQIPSIPETVVNMRQCFYGCTSLSEPPVLSSNVTDDMSYCFYGCTSLSKPPEIPNSVTNMLGTFNNCTSLSEPPEIPNSVTNMLGTFANCSSLSEPPEIPNSVTNMAGTFANCPSLSEPPEIPNSVTNMDTCFDGCTSLSKPPEIPNSVTSMAYTFSYCTALTQAPIIPSGVKEMTNCFDRCVSLQGNVVAYNDPLVKNNRYIFSGTEKTIFIIDKNPEPATNIWKRETETFQNVHYEADDNPIPNISNFTATRVSAVGSTSFASTGLYAYVQARLMVYDNLIPVGWTNELKSIVLKDNGTVESPTWQPTITDYPADVHCWIYLGDTSTHNLSLQITDSIKENNVEVKSQSSIEAITTISKSYALVDYYHDDVTDTEGMAIGKYAEQADLLDVDMPTLFRQGLSLVDGESVIRTILDYMRPVGSAYSTTDSSFDPNDVWGGTWEKLPEGYVLLSGSENGSYKVGDDTSTTSGYKEYGSNTHTLTVNEMPSHTHNAQMKHDSGSGSAYAIQPTTASVKWSWTSGRIQNTGGGQPHNIMQKSIAVYWWIRTA